MSRPLRGKARKRDFTAYANHCASVNPPAVPLKSHVPPRSRQIEVIDLTQDTPNDIMPSASRAMPTPKRIKCNANALNREKRARMFRKKAPQSYLDVKERVLTQRLTVLSRERCGSDDVPEESVMIAGSTGNVYTVSIGLTPSCDCPHARKGNQCKHIIYVMLRVLKAPENIAYQLALVSSELREVIKNAPPIPGVDTHRKNDTANGTEEDYNRKPIGGECPICYDELDPKEAIVYCKSSCGNNIHQACMQNWRAAARGNATCPYCRAKWEWEADTDFEGKLGNLDTRRLQRNEEGYVNVADQLGLSRERDYSTYHSYWAYGRRGRGG